jgi:lipoate-protein ligase A
MKVLDLTLSSPQCNLACDEVLLDLCEGDDGCEVVRFWEPSEHFVVVGHSSKVDAEVYLPLCAQEKIPVLRRASGGGAVIQGPGCLNYSLILRIPDAGPLKSVSTTNAFIMERHQRAMADLIGSRIEIQGFSDLTLHSLKFSGNAQYRKRRALLFHGTFLHSFNLARMESLLRPPPRQPAYREGRSHRQFVTNIPAAPPRIKKAVASAWDANGAVQEVPLELIETLAKEKYSQFEWTFKF